MEIVLATEPGRKEPYLISDMKAYNALGRNTCVAVMIALIRSLLLLGKDAPFIKHLGGGLYELKPATRGGHKGGARVYFFIHEGLAVLCRAECKTQDQDTDVAKLAHTARIMQTWRKP